MKTSSGMLRLRTPLAWSTRGRIFGAGVSLSINDATVTEGDSGTVIATFTVSLSSSDHTGSHLRYFDGRTIQLQRPTTTTSRTLS